MSLSAALAGLLLLAPPLAGPGDEDEPPPDVVRLLDGRELEGQVVYEDGRVVVLRRGTQEQRYEAREVDWVRSAASRARALVSALDGLPPEDPAALLALADEIEADQLAGEARLLRLRALALDPGNEAAHLALGHRRQGDSWSWPDGARNWPESRLFARRAEWGNAWELASTHYRVRANLPLRDAVDMALDLERFYHAFARALRELELHEPWEPLHVHLHADAASFPELGLERAGSYDREARLVRVGFAAGGTRWNLIHEAAHQLLHAQAERTPRSRGEVPAWAEEGLAEYLAAATLGPPGGSFLNPGEPALHHFRAHAEAKDPYDLERVLGLGFGEFLTTTDAALKYAQAYTLVEFCLHGESGRYRRAFLAYVRGSFEEAARKKHFAKALGLEDLRAFEAAWKAYVAEQARGA
jgi:hypothetical protein